MDNLTGFWRKVPISVSILRSTVAEKKQGLAGFRCLINDRLDVVDKSHVKHPVDFIEN